MIEKLTLTKISFMDQRDGKQLISKTGKPYTMVFIEAADGVKYSMYADHTMGAKKLEIAQSWKEGDVVEVNLTQNGQYLNFDIPSKQDYLETRISRLELDVRDLKDLVKKLIDNEKQPKTFGETKKEGVGRVQQVHSPEGLPTYDGY